MPANRIVGINAQSNLCFDLRGNPYSHIINNENNDRTAR